VFGPAYKSLHSISLSRLLFLFKVEHFTLCGSSAASNLPLRQWRNGSSSILLNLLIIPCHYNKHGQKLRRANLFGTSGNPIWKVVWSLEVPAKIKIHCWRSLLGAIPCYGVLALIGTSRSHPSARCVLSTAMYKAHFLSMCSCEELEKSRTVGSN
jgi:hypothetical protein